MVSQSELKEAPVGTVWGHVNNQYWIKLGADQFDCFNLTKSHSRYTLNQVLGYDCIPLLVHELEPAKKVLQTLYPNLLWTTTKETIYCTVCNNLL